MTNEEKFANLSKTKQDILLVLCNSVDIQMSEEVRKLLSFDKYVQSILVRIKEEYTYDEMYEIAHGGNIIDQYEDLQKDLDNAEEELLDVEHERDEYELVGQYFPVENLLDLQKIEILQEFYKLNIRQLEHLAYHNHLMKSLSKEIKHSELNSKSGISHGYNPEDVINEAKQYGESIKIKKDIKYE